MTQVKIVNGNLYIVFHDIVDDETVIVYKLDNGAEFEFADNQMSTLILPNFEKQLGLGDLSNVEMHLENISMDNDILLFTLNIAGQNINGRIDCSSIQ